jgi:excinuclease UvrABC nuclease subunit
MWEEISPFQSLIPKKCGVYAVYINDRLGYIGSTENIRDRLRGHRFGHRGKSPEGLRYYSFKGLEDILKIRVKYKLCKPGYHLMLEYLLIRRLKPFLNIQGNPSIKQKPSSIMKRKDHILFYQNKRLKND